LFSKVVGHQYFPGKRIITYLSFSFLFLFAAFGVQAQNNTVSAIAVPATQAGTITYGSTSVASYNITLTCDGNSSGDGSTNLNIVWTGAQPTGVTLSFSPSNPITLTGGKSSIQVTLNITSA